MRWYVQHRYLLLCLIIVILFFMKIEFGGWRGDFFAHVSAARELATHPFKPVHGQVSSSACWEFYTPYTFIIALFSYITGLNAISALSIGGIANLLFFLFALRLFAIRLFHSETTAFYALLFILLFWGEKPWNFSGFFHVRVIGYILPYPSTFAFASVLTVFSLFIEIIQNKRLFLLPLIGFLTWLVVLTNIFSTILLIIGIMAFAISYYERRRMLEIGLTIITLLVSIVATSLWPYYSIFSTLFAESESGYHTFNRMMYNESLMRTYPVLIGLPFLFLRIKARWRDPLGLMFFGFTSLYIYGAISGKWSFGRVIFFMVFTLHLASADWCKLIEEKIHKGIKIGLMTKIALVFITLLFFFSTFNIIKNCKIYWSEDDYKFEEYSFLSGYTKQYDKIITDIHTAYYVPVFGGKVVAVPNPLVFVKDHDERKEDIDVFFRTSTSNQERYEIINKYQADYILLKKNQNNETEGLKTIFMDLGNIIFENDIFILYKVRP